MYIILFRTKYELEHDSEKMPNNIGNKIILIIPLKREK